MSEAQVDLDWLCQWLEENSSGVYHPAKEAAHVIRQLVKKLEAVEAKASDWQRRCEATISEYLTLTETLATVQSERDLFEQVIREAREQKPSGYVDFSRLKDDTPMATFEKYTDRQEPFYAAPVPAKSEVKHNIDKEPIGFVDSEGHPHLSRQVYGGYLYWGYAPAVTPDEHHEEHDTIFDAVVNATPLGGTRVKDTNYCRCSDDTPSDKDCGCAFGQCRKGLIF
jgi:hypothetical protein